MKYKLVGLLAVLQGIQSTMNVQWKVITRAPDFSVGSTFKIHVSLSPDTCYTSKWQLVTLAFVLATIIQPNQ